MNFETPSLGAAILANPITSFSYEWLETNGLGGYAMSTPVFLNTRKYHSLLTMRPNGLDERHNLLSHFDIEVVYRGETHRISTNQYPAVLHPRGFQNARLFTLDVHPETIFRCDDIDVTIGMLMPRGRDIIILKISIASAADPVRTVGTGVVRMRPFFAYREHHGLAVENENARLVVDERPDGFRIAPYTGLPAVTFFSANTIRFVSEADWYRCFSYVCEQERGYDFEEDLVTPGSFELNFSSAASLYVSATAEAAGGDDPVILFEDEIFRRLVERERIKKHLDLPGTPYVQLLAEQSRHFLVDKEREETPSIIAGFPWFGEWGRDAMIALEGLTLDLGKYDEALGILTSFAGHEQDGLFPNQLSITGNSSYNTVDASLWFFHAVDRYIKVTGDVDGASSALHPTMARILSAYFENRVPNAMLTSNGILHAGSPDTQLTWMDASVSGVPVTPRHGFPVEIQALWYNALCVFAELDCGSHRLSARIIDTISRLESEIPRLFWLEDGYLADVILPDGTVDTAVRPNQIIAVALPHVVFSREQIVRILARVEEQLLTPCGMRTLNPTHAAYAGSYRGSQEQRDRSYHQGTVWPWLIGYFCDACVRHLDPDSQLIKRIARVVERFMADHLTQVGVGSVSEVFDGDSPFLPGGCPMQAWSVAGLLHAVLLLSGFER